MSFQFIPKDKVEVPEISFEERIELEPQKTALLIVDMQNDFVKENGRLSVPAAQETVPAIRQLIDRGRQAGARIAYTQDTHFENDREWDIWPEHCRHGTWGWQIVDELKPQKSDLICQKNRYDGFYQTWLDHYLSHVWHVRHLIITGTMSNVCVTETAGSAGLRWFDVIIPADSISAQNEFDQAMTLRQVTWLYAGRVLKAAKDIQFTKSRV